MEVGLESGMPTYSGGLGVLAGDTLRAAADRGLPMVGLTLLHRGGYFRQVLDEHGHQSELPVSWEPEAYMRPLPTTVTVTIEGRPVQVQPWRYLVRGVNGHGVPVLFLDAALPANAPEDQALTGVLYGGDARYRLAQEVLLGYGGIAVLRALGFTDVRAYHMNEGHSALLTLALLEERTRGRGLRSATDADLDAVRRQCVFTTHTPVPAGHDQFGLDLVRQVLGTERAAFLEGSPACPGGVLNMTALALYLARYVNGVAMRHSEVSRHLFPAYPINAITNGVHAVTWTSPPFARLYDRHIPEWRRDNLYLRYAVGIPLEEIQAAHAEAEAALLVEVERRTGRRLAPGVLTLAFARRATAYKRADLLLADPERLRRIAQQSGGLQVLYAGKAHPRDDDGKALIRRVVGIAAALRDAVPIVYLEEYDLALARLLCAGADVWLNTPQKPQEASGTSGMKAALNGVPSLSVLDGWWIEGHVEGVTGWAIGDSSPTSDPVAEAASLYHQLEAVVAPLFYHRPDEFLRVRRAAIALNAAFFNAQRMLDQYIRNAYVAE